jgi:hypothetical protein
MDSPFNVSSSLFRPIRIDEPAASTIPATRPAGSAVIGLLTLHILTVSLKLKLA